MSISGIVPPPPRIRPWKGKGNNPKCGVCAKTLRMDDIHGVDQQLGPICRACGPHVVAANRLLHPFWV
jgi:hypothetical protein